MKITENHENLRIPFENNENHENHKIIREIIKIIKIKQKFQKRIMKIMKIIILKQENRKSLKFWNSTPELRKSRKS